VSRTDNQRVLDILTGGAVADLDDPGPAAVAGDGDLSPLQVHVTTLAVTGAVPDPGQLGTAGSRSPGTPR
jgi:hypothetical protein